MIGDRPAALPITVGAVARGLAEYTVDALSAQTENTTRSSRVQNGALSFAASLVSRISSPPSGLVTYTSFVPERFDMKAIASPLGDTEGRPPLMTGRLGCCAASSAGPTIKSANNLVNMRDRSRKGSLTLPALCASLVDGAFRSCSGLMILSRSQAIPVLRPAPCG